jgi:hypothetical protein
MAKGLIISGAVLIFIGLVILFTDKLTGPIPGDIYIKNKNFSIYIGITSSIIISLIINLIMRMISK